MQRGMPKVGQSIGVLDKLKDYSKIGFTCFVKKEATEFSVTGRERMAAAFAVPRFLLSHTSGDACSHGFPKASGHTLSPKTI